MGVKNKDFFINFTKWLEVRKRHEEHYVKILSSFVLPLIIVLFSLFPTLSSTLLSSSQWQDSAQIRIDYELISTGNKAPVESLQESVNKISIATKYAYFVLYTVLICIVVSIITFCLLVKCRLKKIDFYNDCQMIIREEFLS